MSFYLGVQFGDLVGKFSIYCSMMWFYYWFFQFFKYLIEGFVEVVMIGLVFGVEMVWDFYVGYLCNGGVNILMFQMNYCLIWSYDKGVRLLIFCVVGVRVNDNDLFSVMFRWYGDDVFRIKV